MLYDTFFFSPTRDVHVSYTKEKFDDFGGYTDPKDVKRPEKYICFSYNSQHCKCFLVFILSYLENVDEYFILLYLHSLASH